jgi:hypothetical protein
MSFKCAPHVEQRCRHTFDLRSYQSATFKLLNDPLLIEGVPEVSDLVPTVEIGASPGEENRPVSEAVIVRLR